MNQNDKKKNIMNYKKAISPMLGYPNLSEVAFLDNMINSFIGSLNLPSSSVLEDKTAVYHRI